MLIANTGRPWESMLGVGQFGTPCERMHWAKFRSSFSTCCTRARGQSPAIMHCWTESALIAPPLFREQVLAGLPAACSWELLTPKSLRVGLGELSAAVGVGEVRHAVGAHAGRVGDRRRGARRPPALGEPPGPVDEGLPLHAGASRARATAAMRAADGRPSAAVPLTIRTPFRGSRSASCRCRCGPRRRSVAPTAGIRASWRRTAMTAEGWRAGRTWARWDTGAYGVGSGQFDTPWERMHRANFSIPLHQRCTSAWVRPLSPPGGAGARRLGPPPGTGRC